MPIARPTRPLLLLMIAVLAMVVGVGDHATGATASPAVTVNVLEVTSIGAGGCLPGVAGTTAFGSIPAGTTSWTSGDCHVTWSTNASTAMLRMYQTDGTGHAMTSAGSFVPDYAPGTNDWTTGAGAFGACLRTMGATTAAVWDDDAACTHADGTHWQAVPTSAADLDARIASSDSNGEVRLQFGLRTPTSQLAQAYGAGITFEVVAPDPGPGAVPTAGTVAVTGTASIGQTLTATPSGWTLGNPAGTYAYQWIRCGTGGNTCVDIPGETGSTYVVTGADGGRTIRVRADVVNMFGSATATSNQTAVVPDIIGSEGGTTYVSPGNVSSASAGLPSGAFEGDLLVAQLVVRDGSDVIITSVPSGWTLIRRTNESNRVMLATYYKVMTAADAGPQTWSWNLAVNDRATLGIQAFSAVDPATPIQTWSENASTSVTTSAPSVTPTTANSILLTFDGTRDNVTFTPDGNPMTQLWQLSGAGNVSAYGRMQVVAAVPTGVRQSTISLSTRWASQNIVLKPRP